MKVKDAIRRAEYLIDDEFEPINSVDLVNDCLDDLSIEAPYEDRVTLVVNRASNSVALPSNLTSISGIYYGNKQLKPIKDLGTFDELATGSEPAYYYILAGNILLYPLVDSAYSIKIMFQSGYGNISSVEDDLPSSLPSKFHKIVMWYLITQYRIQDEELDEVQLYGTEYYKQRNALKLYLENLKEQYNSPSSS